MPQKHTARAGRMVGDGRTAPWCWQDIPTMQLIRSHWHGAQRSTAISIYQALTEVANERRSRDEFIAERNYIAERAGVHHATFDRYIKQMEQLGIVAVERRKDGAVNLPNLWTLTDPPGVAASGGQGPHQAARVAAQGGQGVAASGGPSTQEGEHQEKPTGIDDAPAPGSREITPRPKEDDLHLTAKQRAKRSSPRGRGTSPAPAGEKITRPARKNAADEIDRVFAELERKKGLT